MFVLGLYLGHDVAHRRRVPFAAPRSFDSPRVQFCCDLAKGCAPCPDLLDHWQDVLSMGRRPRFVHRRAPAGRLTLSKHVFTERFALDDVRELLGVEADKLATYRISLTPQVMRSHADVYNFRKANVHFGRCGESSDHFGKTGRVEAFWFSRKTADRCLLKAAGWQAV